MRSRRGDYPLRLCAAAALFGLALLASLGSSAGAAPQAARSERLPVGRVYQRVGCSSHGDHNNSVGSIKFTPPLQNAAGDIFTPPDGSLLCGGGMSTVTLPQCQTEGTSPTAPRIALVGDSEARTWSISSWMRSPGRHRLQLPAAGQDRVHYGQPPHTGPLLKGSVHIVPGLPEVGFRPNYILQAQHLGDIHAGRAVLYGKREGDLARRFTRRHSK